MSEHAIIASLIGVYVVGVWATLFFVGITGKHIRILCEPGCDLVCAIMWPATFLIVGFIWCIEKIVDVLVLMNNFICDIDIKTQIISKFVSFAICILWWTTLPIRPRALGRFIRERKEERERKKRREFHRRIEEMRQNKIELL